MQVRIRVVHVNDFLYTYEVKVKYEPKAADNISDAELKALIPQLAAASIGNPCASIDGHAEKASVLAKEFVVTADKDGLFPSKTLKASQQDWAKLEPEFQAFENAMGAEKTCPSYLTYVKTLQEKMRGLAKISKGDHEFTSDHVFPADGEYTVEAIEFYDKKPTAAKYTAKFYARSSIFFLSVGYLGSQVQSRSYDTVDVATGKKELRIQGTGTWRPTAAILLNYKLPWWQRLNGEKSSLAISAGPVYRTISSQTGSTSTNWGAFAGLSVSLWDRLVLTPGMHVGEFADMPLGFDNSRDRSIPAGIANPITGVNRWTTRFGIGITFQVADFKKAAALATFTKAPAAPGTPAPTPPAATPPAAVVPAAAAPAAPKVLSQAEAQNNLDKAKKLFAEKKKTRLEIEKLDDAEADPEKKKITMLALKQAQAEENAASLAVVAAEKILAESGPN